MVNRKIGNSHTTICITWSDKEEFRKYAKLVKKTKNGDMYESDAALFHKLLETYKQYNQGSEAHNTYPKKSKNSQGHDQQG